jgi:hypothetical protein
MLLVCEDPFWRDAIRQWSNQGIPAGQLLDHYTGAWDHSRDSVQSTELFDHLQRIRKKSPDLDNYEENVISTLPHQWTVNKFTGLTALGYHYHTTEEFEARICGAKTGWVSGSFFKIPICVVEAYLALSQKNCSNPGLAIEEIMAYEHDYSDIRVGQAFEYVYGRVLFFFGTSYWDNSCQVSLAAVQIFKPDAVNYNHTSLRPILNADDSNTYDVCVIQARHCAYRTLMFDRMVWKDVDDLAPRGMKRREQWIVFPEPTDAISDLIEAEGAREEYDNSSDTD